MRTPRAVLVTLSFSALSILAVAMGEACGGKLTVGYDDAGNFHTGDGGVLVYGGACVGWDASHYAGGNIDQTTTCDLNTDECTRWFIPSTWPQTEKCYQRALVDDAGVEVRDDAGHVIPIDSGVCGPDALQPATCNHNDPASDAFCVAWFEQFVTHGHVHAKCGVWANVANTCSPTEEILGCGTWAIDDDDGGQTCFSPCRP